MKGYFGVKRGPGRTLGVVLAAALAWLLLGPAAARAATIVTGDATEYQVNIVSVSLCTDSTCTTKFGVGDNNQTFDIASVNIGEAAGTFGDLSGLPIGATVTHIEVVMGREFTVTGSVNVDGSTICYTDSTASAGSILTPTLGKKTSPATSQNLFIPDAIYSGEPSDATLAAFHVSRISDTAVSAIVPLSSPYTITGTAPTVTISLSTQDAVGAALVSGNCVMLVQAPTVTIGLQ